MTLHDFINIFMDNSTLMGIFFISAFGVFTGKWLGIFRTWRFTIILIKLFGYSILLYAFWKSDTGAKLDAVTLFTIFVCVAEIFSNLFELIISNVEKIFEKSTREEIIEILQERDTWKNESRHKISSSFYEVRDQIHKNLEAKLGVICCQKCSTRLETSNMNLMSLKGERTYAISEYIVFTCTTCGHGELYSSYTCGLNIHADKCYVKDYLSI